VGLPASGGSLSAQNCRVSVSRLGTLFFGQPAGSAETKRDKTSYQDDRRRPESIAEILKNGFGLTVPLESFVTKTRDKAAALKFIKKAMKRHGRPKAIVTDGLRSYGAAMKALGARDLQAPIGRWKNNRVENSHLPFRRRERAMNRFRRMKTLQKFVSVHASVHNHFSQERHLVSRQIYKQRRAAALAAWRAVMA